MKTYLSPVISTDSGFLPEPASGTKTVRAMFKDIFKHCPLKVKLNQGFADLLYTGIPVPCLH